MGRCGRNRFISLEFDSVPRFFRLSTFSIFADSLPCCQHSIYFLISLSPCRIHLSLACLFSLPFHRCRCSPSKLDAGNGLSVADASFSPSFEERLNGGEKPNEVRSRTSSDLSSRRTRAKGHRALLNSKDISISASSFSATLVRHSPLQSYSLPRGS